jgi:hypothetical protein
MLPLRSVESDRPGTLYPTFGTWESDEHLFDASEHRTLIQTFIPNNSSNRFVPLSRQASADQPPRNSRFTTTGRLPANPLYSQIVVIHWIGAGERHVVLFVSPVLLSSAWASLFIFADPSVVPLRTAGSLQPHTAIESTMGVNAADPW